MRTTINNKRIQTGFLLVALLFLQYINYGIFSLAPWGSSGTDKPAAALSGRAGSPMSDSIGVALDVMGVLGDGAWLKPAPAGKSRVPGCNNNNSLAAITAAALLAGLFSYLRLSRQIYIQFDSLQITTFLHKKDGKK